MSPSRAYAKALGLTRGKCRWCAASVQEAHHGWASEDGAAEPYDCPAAARRPCPGCETAGETLDERTGRARRCIVCGGTGYVPGPHWPYRHPNPLGET